MITELPAGVVEALVTVLSQEIAAIKKVDPVEYRDSLVSQILELTNASIDTAVERQAADRAALQR